VLWFGAAVDAQIDLLTPEQPADVRRVADNDEECEATDNTGLPIGR